MGITAKSIAKLSDSWGMGMLLVFFPEDHNQASSPSPELSKPTSSSSLFSTSILTRTQSTISICALFLLFTLILFAASTFEPSLSPISPRRMLSDRGRLPPTAMPISPKFYPALQGMGLIHLRGTRAMQSLVVCHAPEDSSEDDFKVFLRVLLQSGITSRADVALLFPSLSLSRERHFIIRDEVDSFLNLLRSYSDVEMNTNRTEDAFNFNFTKFSLAGKREAKEPLWGKRALNGSTVHNPMSRRVGYGSIVSFDADELDPENALAGFVDHVPMNLRRWACYPMLLGRTRRNFKNIILIDAGDTFVIGDATTRVGKLKTESVILTGRKPDGKRKTQTVGPAAILGGSRGVRRLSGQMLTGIVLLATQQHKKKNLVTEGLVLNRLVGSGHGLKGVDVVEPFESVPEAALAINSSLEHRGPLMHRGSNGYDDNSAIMKRICSHEINYLVYRDCT